MMRFYVGLILHGLPREVRTICHFPAVLTVNFAAESTGAIIALWAADTVNNQTISIHGFSKTNHKITRGDTASPAVGHEQWPTKH